MTHFNVLLSLNKTGALSEATHEQKGIWFDMATYCCAQENGGRIHCADKWTEIQWLKNIGITKEQAYSESPLWKMNDFGTLIVALYPHEHEKAAQKKRASANRTNEMRWGYNRKKKKSLSDTVSESLSDTVSESVGESIRKGKVRKEKDNTSPNGQIAHTP